MAAGARLFAIRGYHSVGVEEIGRALGLTGPALYRHFRSKEALLVAVFDRVIERQLADVRNTVEGAPDADAALAALVAAHVTFALEEREVLAIWRQEFANLPPEDSGRLRRLQRMYVEEWVEVLTAVRPELAEHEARAVVHGTIALLQSPNEYHSGLSPDVLRALLTSMAMAALHQSATAGRATALDSVEPG
ncbi:MAG: TetR/AcrR family transcriptional regulator [Acidimicrobiia bacterium]